MPQLSVNINKVATLRNTRTIGIPSVTHCARLCLDAGAHGITVHPRPDQRHIRPADVHDISELLKSYPRAEFNIEGNPFHAYVEYARQYRPAQCTLVPDETEQFTSDHGWILTDENCQRLQPLIREMRDLGCRVSLFMDADALASGDPVNRARDLGATRVELYTEPYAAAFIQGGDLLKKSLDLYARAASRAQAAGLEINAGHDLNLANLPLFLHHIPAIAEVSIGHALIADALELGLPETVRRFLAITSAVPSS